MNAMHGARRERSAIRTAAPLEFAIERVNVLGAKRLEWEVLPASLSAHDMATLGAHELADLTAHGGPLTLHGTG